MRVLFVVPYPIEAPSSRYRVYQYLPYLEANGIDVTVSRFIDSSDFFRQLYRPGGSVYKAAYFGMRVLHRLLDAAQARRFDAVFVQREAMPIGPALFESMVARLGCPVIYDFDDAIYLLRSSNANRWASWLKSPQKTAQIISLSQQVIVGNQVLAEYATQYSPNVTIVPSSIDTDVYVMRSPQEDLQKPVVIGWVGTGTNLQYLAELAPVLRTLSKRHDICVEVVGGTVDLPGVTASFRPWRLENEVSDLQRFDIGIMPLADDPWTRGKGAFKAIQYMGVGLPVVASPVGMNAEVVVDGETGFLAATDEQWQQALTTLINDAVLRQKFGLAGRKRVEEKYSAAVNGPKLLNVLRAI